MNSILGGISLFANQTDEMALTLVLYLTSFLLVGQDCLVVKGAKGKIFDTMKLTTCTVIPLQEFWPSYLLHILIMKTYFFHPASMQHLFNCLKIYPFPSSLILLSKGFGSEGRRQNRAQYQEKTPPCVFLPFSSS